MTYLEIAERAAAGWLAIVPTGCMEQQGPHLPVDFDSWFAESLMVAAVQQAARRHAIPALVLPALPFGPTPEHRNYGSGYIDVPHPLHQAVVRAVLDSLAKQGFARLVVWQGCGGHNLRATASQFNITWKGRAIAVLPDMPYHAVWCRIGDPAVPGGHADSFATSICLHLRPEAVCREQIVDPRNAPVAWDDPDLDFSRYSETGVIGDPTHASASLGAQLWEACVDAAVEALVEAAGMPLAGGG